MFQKKARQFERCQELNAQIVKNTKHQPTLPFCLEWNTASNAFCFVCCLVLATFWLYQHHVRKVRISDERAIKKHILSRNGEPYWLFMHVYVCVCVRQRARSFSSIPSEIDSEWDRRQQRQRRWTHQQQQQKHRYIYRWLSSKRAYIWFFGNENIRWGFSLTNAVLASGLGFHLILDSWRKIQFTFRQLTLVFVERK